MSRIWSIFSLKSKRSKRMCIDCGTLHNFSRCPECYQRCKCGIWVIKDRYHSINEEEINNVNIQKNSN